MDLLRTAAPQVPLPVIVAASRDPAMLVTQRATAIPFFDVRHLITSAVRPMVAGDLAAVLVGLHDPDVLKAVSQGMSPLLLGDALWRAEAGVALPDGRCVVGCGGDWPGVRYGTGMVCL